MVVLTWYGWDTTGTHLHVARWGLLSIVLAPSSTPRAAPVAAAATVTVAIRGGVTRHVPCQTWLPGGPSTVVAAAA
jgi:hypothetical protein